MPSIMKIALKHFTRQNFYNFVTRNGDISQNNYNVLNQ